MIILQNKCLIISVFLSDTDCLNLIGDFEDKMKYTYGPVPSRRLGLSLGVDIVPLKTCTLSCMYCQVGETPETTISRREYVPVAEVMEELKGLFKRGIKIDWVTFSGSGEPTLNSGIGRLIKGIKTITDIPVCVITNGTLLWDAEVRREINEADAVMPSLDSALDNTFRAICRPHPGLKIKKIIDGLVQFRKEYSGKIWLEIMLVEGINDSPEELAALCDAAVRIEPDVVQLNTVARPPAEISARPLSRERLEEIRDFFGGNAEIIASFKGEAKETTNAGIENIREYLRRRPGSVDDIVAALGIKKHEAEKNIEQLVESGDIILREYFGKRFWEYKG